MLNQLQNLSSLEGQGQALNHYYNSQQYKDLAGQARYQSLAAAEATGGLGSTATGNQLATIAPTLGQQWLSGQMKQLPESGKRWAWCSARSGKRRANICQQHESDFTAKCGAGGGKRQPTVSIAICYWRRCVWCHCWGWTCEINWFINSVGGWYRCWYRSAWFTALLRGNQWLRGNRVLILVVFWLALVRKTRMRQRQATLTQRLV
ncbi:Gene 11 protein [Escherichia coli]|nr:Gene 11 protein [Escherichia coli]